MWAWLDAASASFANATPIDWTALFLGTALVAYWLCTPQYDHFSHRGMPYEQPMPFVGSMGPLACGRTSFNDFALALYAKHEGKRAFGVFRFMQPTVFVRDPELIEMVTVQKFDHFVDHQALVPENADALISRSLFSLKGQEWRDMRGTLSLVFTTSKMRNMFRLIEVCAEQTVKFLEQKTQDNPGGVYEAEMKDIFTRFANDVIATTAFGIECDSLGQPNNEFYRMGRELTKNKGLQSLIFLGYTVSPKLMEFFRIPLLLQRSKNFFHNIVHDTIGERQRKGIFRPDMLQLLMQAREGTLKAEAGDEQEVIKGTTGKQLTDQDITAQAMIFFFAGFDTVATAASYCAYALARHPKAQERLQREVDEVFEMNGGKLTYEAVMHQLKYLDMFISEVLRLYATIPWLDRKCTKDFTIPAHGDVPAYTVRKSETVWIPIHPIHRDPKYWEDPEKFDPERFSDENKHKIQPYTYFPFGIGPRICIGNRFALLEVKVALAHILRHFRFQMTPKTPKKVEYSPSDFSGNIKGGFWVGVAPRTQ